MAALFGLSNTNQLERVNMNTDKSRALNLTDLTTLLIRHFDIHEGIYQLNINFVIGVGGIPASSDATARVLPGAMVGIDGIALSKITDDQEMSRLPNLVDAAEVNPKPRAKMAATKSATKKKAE